MRAHRTIVVLLAACSGNVGDPAHPDAAGPGAIDAADPGAIDAGIEPAEYIEPDDPGPADLRIDVHTGERRQAISPFIYGTNSFEDSTGRFTLSRIGGNRWTAYNWENNASNAGSDWFHQNDGFLGGGDTPGEAVRSRVAGAHSADAAIVVTVPIAGYVAADKAGDGDVANSADYLATRFRESVARKAAPFGAPDLGDARVYQDEFVAWLESTFPGARTDPRRTIFYSLDNEPDLWSETHARIHPEALTYAELRDRTVDYAAALKDAAPGALVLGPVSYGWNGYVSLQDAPDAAGRDFLDWYLDELSAAEAAAGERLVDVLDLHWYPEAQGGGRRITADDADPDIAAARLQAPRSLWDPNYTEDSWIAMWSTGGPIRLLPRLRDKIAAHYPGTRIGFTEYYYGGGADISGGLAQADVLGLFGRYGVFAAALWHLGETDDRFIHGGFALYRNYDGDGGEFGDTAVAADHDDDPGRTSAYASIDAGRDDRVVVIAINKSGAEVDAGIAVTHTRRMQRAEVYVLTAAQPAPAAGAEIAITATNAFVYAMPPLSATVLVLRP